MKILSKAKTKYVKSRIKPIIDYIRDETFNDYLGSIYVSGDYIDVYFIVTGSQRVRKIRDKNFTENESLVKLINGNLDKIKRSYICYDSSNKEFSFSTWEFPDF